MLIGGYSRLGCSTKVGKHHCALCFQEAPHHMLKLLHDWRCFGRSWRLQYWSHRLLADRVHMTIARERLGNLGRFWYIAVFVLTPNSPFVVPCRNRALEDNRMRHRSRL